MDQGGFFLTLLFSCKGFEIFLLLTKRAHIISSGSALSCLSFFWTTFFMWNWFHNGEIVDREYLFETHSKPATVCIVDTDFESQFWKIKIVSIISGVCFGANFLYHWRMTLHDISCRNEEAKVIVLIRRLMPLHVCQVKWLTMFSGSYNANGYATPGNYFFMLRLRLRVAESFWKSWKWISNRNNPSESAQPHFSLYR